MSDFYDCSPEEQGDRLTRLAQKALAEWDIDSMAVLDLIKHRENAVFSVKTADVRYALRVHRANYHSDNELSSELSWIDSINSDELRTPQIISSKSGDQFVKVITDEVPEAHQVDMLEWFDGAPIASIENGIEDLTQVGPIFNQVGTLMAITHNHSETWERPASFERHAWDADGILGDNPFWGSYKDLEPITEDQRALFEQATTKACAELAEFGQTADRYGLIHADFLPENLLKNEDSICLIDFDDAGFGWHLFDIATTLFFQLGEAHFDDALGALLEGYRSKRELPDEHLTHLELFFLLRGFTYLGWAHTRKETETAQAMTPVIIAAVEEMAGAYI